MRRTRSRTQETMLFVVGENEIHMVSPRVTGSSYADIIGILVKDILEEYGLESKVKKAKEQVKSELEPEEEVIEESEEIEEEEEELTDEDYEEEIEELDESELSDAIEEIDYQMEIQKEKNSIPEWLELGWIMYRRGILNSDKNKQDYAEFIAKKGVASKNKISQKSSVMADYNFASESSAAIVEYIVRNYGVRRVLDLVGEPDIEKTLRISEGKFKREYTAWIKKMYVVSKLDKKLEKEKQEKLNSFQQDIDVKEKDTK